MGVKLKPADTWFSKCVRESQDYMCEKCGAQHDRSSKGLHCSHVFSRRHRTIRWCKDNAQSLCASCHQWYGGNPVESGKWFEDLVGEAFVEMLVEKKNNKVKVSKIEEKEIAAHYRSQHKSLVERRGAGDVGVLDFESWQ